MFKSAATRRGPGRRYWPTPSMLIAGTALFVSLGGSAVAAERLIRSADIAPNAVTSAKIKDGSVTLADLQPRTVASLRGGAGTNGINGADGVLGPLSTTAGLTALPTATPPTTVVSLTVPAGNYVVFAKTQLMHTGAGDSVTCQLKAGAATIDEGSIKTLPALAVVPVALQAVTATSPTQLSVQCDVTTANGSADFTSLIALPVN